MLRRNKPTVAYTSGTGIWSILSQAGRNQRSRSSSALNCRQVACNLARDNYTREFHFRPPIPISDLLACRCSGRVCSLSYRFTTMSPYLLSQLPVSIFLRSGSLSLGCLRRRCASSKWRKSERTYKERKREREKGRRTTRVLSNTM